MNTTEERLADALDAAAETIRPGTLRPLTRAGGGARFRAKVWNTRLAPAAAAAAVLLAVGVAFLIPGLVGAHHGPTPAGPRPGSGPAGPASAPLPRYYAEVEGNISHGPRFVVVRSTGTGAVVAQVPNPVDARHKQLDAIDVTTRDDQRFYVLYSERGVTRNGDFMVYTFTLSPAGTVTGPAEVPGGVITGQYYLALDGGFAVAPDGTELAIATADPAAKGIPKALAEQIVLINTRTGARATWKGGLDRAGSLFNLENLSWTADSGALVYLAQWCPQGYSDQGSTGVGCITGFSSEQVRELSVSSGGGLLTSGPVLLRSSARIHYISAALINPDGTELTVLAVVGGTSLQVATIDIGTGKTQRVLYRLPANDTSEDQISEFHLVLDDTGQNVLLGANPAHGRISGGHLVSLPPKTWDGSPVSW